MYYQKFKCDLNIKFMIFKKMKEKLMEDFFSHILIDVKIFINKFQLKEIFVNPFVQIIIL
jgi:hypothetical protein